MLVARRVQANVVVLSNEGKFWSNGADGPSEKPYPLPGHILFGLKNKNKNKLPNTKKSTNIQVICCAPDTSGSTNGTRKS